MGDSELAIRNLVHTYAELVDAGDFDAVGRLFTNATYRALTPDGMRVANGAREVTGQLSHMVRRFGDGTPGTRHLTTNHIIEVDERAGTATCRCYYTVMQVADGRLQPILCGRYHDEFVRTEEGWRFTDRLVLSDLIGDLSHHLTFNPLQ